MSFAPPLRSAARRIFAPPSAPHPPLAVLLLLLAASLVLGACTVARVAGVAPPPAEAPPLGLGGQRVLLVPVQGGAGVEEGVRARLEAELAFALAERDREVVWVMPAALRAAAARSPGFATNPDRLPADRFLHHGERHIVEPLLGGLRRFAALTDVRLILVPYRATFLPPEGTAAEGRLRLDAALVDVRSGDLVWWGRAEAPAAGAGEVDASSAARLAASLAARLLVPTAAR